MRVAALALLVAASAAVSGAASAASAPDAGCVAALRAYDRAELFFTYDGAWRGVALPPPIERQAQRARRDGCVTSNDDTDRLLAGADAFAAPPRPEGAPIRPTWLQVGVVGGVVGEVRARDFFAGQGYRVRSRGAPGLGRRIFVGPFATEGALADAAGLAVRAGFVAPYPRAF
jgi:hypothetical protein